MSVPYDEIRRFSDVVDTGESECDDKLRLYIDESTIIETQKYTDQEYEAMDNRLLELIKSCH